MGGAVGTPDREELPTADLLYHQKKHQAEEAEEETAKVEVVHKLMSK